MARGRRIIRQAVCRSYAGCGSCGREGDCQSALMRPPNQLVIQPSLRWNQLVTQPSLRRNQLVTQPTLRWNQHLTQPSLRWNQLVTQPSLRWNQLVTQPSLRWNALNLRATICASIPSDAQWNGHALNFTVTHARAHHLQLSFLHSWFIEKALAAP